MTNTVIIKGKKANDSIDFKITRKLNEVDIMTFSVFNDYINRNRYQLEEEMRVELLGEWGVITRRKISDDRINLTWEQRAWHLKRRLYDEREYTMSVKEEVDQLVKAANNSDIPYNVTVSYHNINSDAIVTGNLKFNTYFEALQSICSSGNYNIRFKGTNIDFGKFQNVINVSNNKRIIDQLESDKDLSKFGNNLHMIGKSGDQIGNDIVINNSGTRWIYDKVISNSKIENENEIPEEVVREYGSIRPIIGFQIKLNEYERYGFEPGDILKVDLGDNETGENGFYRIVKIEIGKLNVDLYFEFSNDGVFSSRTFDPSDTLSYIGKKIKEIEIFR